MAERTGISYGVFGYDADYRPSCGSVEALRRRGKALMDRYTEPHWNRSALLTPYVRRNFTVPGAPAIIPGNPEIVPAVQRLVRAYSLHYYEFWGEL
jgi:hypothetical protein